MEGLAMEYATVDDCIRARPVSLTGDRAESFLPRTIVNEEWQRKHEAGELPPGLAGMFGCLSSVWPESQPTREEAEWILSLQKFGTIRWVASIVTHGDDNQITGCDLLEAARRVIGGA
jgi:hypothetical protein